MDTAKYKFLNAVLGSDGAKALIKASKRAPELEPVFLPRTIVSWIGAVDSEEFEGAIPGNSNSYVQFTKNEGRYSGSVAIGDEVYSFEKASMLHLGACMAVALGADQDTVSGADLREVEIQRLGKNIDALVKAKIAVADLSKKLLDPSAGYTFTHEHHDLGDGEALTHVKAHAPGGAVVGEALFNHHPSGSLIAEGVKVHPDHQRKGIASAIYSHAQKLTGKTIAPSHDQTAAGKALWQGNVGQQQFGSLTKAIKKPHSGQETPGPAHAATPPTGPLPPTPADPSQGSKGPTVGAKPRLPKPPKPSEPSISPEQAKPGAMATKPGATAAKPAASKMKPVSVPKLPGMKVTKSEAGSKCQICGQCQFKADTFQGCMCFRALAKSVTTAVTEDGYNLTFKSDWDQDAILALTDTIRNKR